MRALAPDTKVIFVLRNPVDRAFSEYQAYTARSPAPHMPFAAMVKVTQSNSNGCCWWWCCCCWQWCRHRCKLTPQSAFHFCASFHSSLSSLAYRLVCIHGMCNYLHFVVSCAFAVGFCRQQQQIEWLGKNCSVVAEQAYVERGLYAKQLRRYFDVFVLHSFVVNACDCCFANMSFGMHMCALAESVDQML